MNKILKKTLIALSCAALSVLLAVGFSGCSKTLPQWIREQQCGAHEWNDGEVTKEATCTEEGETLFTCTSCGATETQPRAILPHNEKEVAEVPSTCTETGWTDGIQCADCEVWLEGHEIIPLKEHTVVYQGAVAASCLTKGKTEGSYCSVCETVFAEQEEIAALGHNIVVYAGYAATCELDGLTQGQECLRCGKVYLAQEVIPATGHNVQTLEGYPATCTGTGLTDGEKCLRCGKTYLAQEVIPAIEHTVQTLEGYPATCTSTGKTEGSRCTTCGETLEIQAVIPALAHRAKTLGAVAPTCTSTGLTSGQECMRCGATLKAQEIVAPLAHTVVTVAEIPAGCKSTGQTAYTKCSVCNTYLTSPQVILPAHTGLVSTPAVAATCLEAGRTKGEMCEDCGEVLIESTEIAALGHTDGNADNVCDACGLVIDLATFVSSGNYTLEAVEVGELACGNVYRVYYDYYPIRTDDQPEHIWIPRNLIFSNGSQLHSIYQSNGAGQIMSRALGDYGIDYPAEYCVQGEDADGKYYDYLIVEGMEFELVVSFAQGSIGKETFVFTTDMTVSRFSSEGVYRLEPKQTPEGPEETPEGPAETPEGPEETPDGDYTFVEAGNYTLEAVEVGEAVVGNWYRVYTNYLPDRATDMPEDMNNGKSIVFSNGVTFNQSWETGIITDLGVSVAQFSKESGFIIGNDDKGSFVDFYVTEGWTLNLLASIDGEGSNSSFPPQNRDFVFTESVVIQQCSSEGVYRIEPTA